MNSSPPSQPAPEMPSELTRNVLSLALMIHLFGILVAVMSTGMPSELYRRLRSVPALSHYFQLLFLDQPYRYAHTLGQDMDWGYQLDVELKERTDKGVIAKKTVRIHPEPVRPWIRETRRQALLHEIYLRARERRDSPDPAGPEDFDTLLPVALANRVMIEEQASHAEVRCRGRSLKPWTEATSTQDNFEDIFIADVRRPAGGQMTFAKRELGQNRNAPVVGGAPATREGTPAPPVRRTGAPTGAAPKTTGAPGTAPKPTGAPGGDKAPQTPFRPDAPPVPGARPGG